MTTARAHQEVPDWSIDSSLATVLGLPPNDPSDDDEDEEDDDEDEGEDEPAVVREPDAMCLRLATRNRISSLMLTGNG
jgi:hypothetical protein